MCLLVRHIAPPGAANRPSLFHKLYHLVRQIVPPCSTNCATWCGKLHAAINVTPPGAANYTSWCGNLVRQMNHLRACTWPPLPPAPAPPTPLYLCCACTPGRLFLRRQHRQHDNTRAVRAHLAASTLGRLFLQHQPRPTPQYSRRTCTAGRLFLRRQSRPTL